MGSVRRHTAAAHRSGRGAATAALAVVAALAVGACGVSGDESGPRKPEPTDGDGVTSVIPPNSPRTAPSTAPVDDPVFPGTSNPLSSYEGSASYEYRANIVDNADELLSALQEVEPELDESDLDDVVSTCEDLTGGGLDDAQVEERAAGRFGVDQASVAPLVEASQTYACPS